MEHRRLLIRLAPAAAAAAVGLSLLTAPAGAAPQVAAGAAVSGGASAKGITVRWDWSMPTFMKDRRTFVPTSDKNDPDWFRGGSYVPGPDGIPDRPMATVKHYENAGNARYGALPRDGRFTVRLDAGRTTGPGPLRCTWDIAGQRRPVTAACADPVRLKLPEGRHRVTLTVRGKGGRTVTAASHLTVRNVLIAVLGDSYASGEGFPPFTEATSDGTGRQIDWDYASCNRSRWAGFVRAAQQVESADPRSNVTLVDVACAGGEVDKGYIRTIESVAPPVTKENPTGGILYPKRRLKANGVQLPGYEEPQVDQVRSIVRGATVDTLLLSIGGNDAGLSDIGIACALEDFAKPNCYNEVPFFWDTKPQAKPLYQVIERNLTALERRYERMAPCFGAGGRCRTTKVAGDKPAKRATPSRPLALSRAKNLIHAAYPDLTSTTDAGAIVPCTNKPVPQSPMNQIDNSWAFDGLYVGQTGRPYSLPLTYSPPLPKPNPVTITPTADGIVPLIRSNARRYGWTAEPGVFRESRGRGLCAGADAWEYGLTAATLAKNPANSSGALHPNDAGQEAYGRVLGARAEQRSGVPVRTWPTTILNGRG